MASEVLQFTGFLCVVGVAFVLWLFVVYLPGRTLENGWKDQRKTGATSQPPAPESRETTPGEGVRDAG